jgi:hypothetical protein
MSAGPIVGTDNHMAAPRPRLAWRAAVLLLAIAALVPCLLLLLGCRYLLWEGAFNSDDLYSSIMAADVLAGRAVRGWHLPGAPYIFPDLPLSLPCRWLAPNLVVEFLAYCLVFWLCVTAVVFWLARLLGLTGRQAFVAAGVGVAFLAAVFLGRSDFTSALLAHAGSHTGALLTGLFLLALTTRAVRRGAWGPAAAAAYLLAGGLGAFSDRLVVVQFLLPTALGLIVLTAGRRLRPRQLATHLALLVGVGLVYLGTRALFVRLGFQLLVVEDQFSRPHLADFLRGLSHMRRDVAHYPLLAAVIPFYFLFASLGLAAARAGDEAATPARGLVALTLILVPVCNLLALLATGAEVADRYTLPCWVLPPLFVPLLAVLVPPWPRRRLAGPVTAAVLGLCAVFRAAAFVPEVSADRLAPPYPPLARTLDRLAAERGPIRGLSGFWTGRSINMLAHGPIFVNTMTNGGAPWFHADNPNRFLDDDQNNLAVPDYTFAIIDRGERGLYWGIDPQAAEALFGPPVRRLPADCPGREVWLYDHIEFGALDTFQRARLAERARRVRSYRVPQSPAMLARPKWNLTPVDGCDCVRLPARQAVEVHFAEAVYGAVLDVAADSMDSYALRFYRGSQEVGALAVPPVPWTGAVYGPPGMQARLLPLPDPLRQGGWDRVVAVALRPDADCHLGHLLVLDEPLPGMPRTAVPGRTWRYEAEALPTHLDPKRSRRADRYASGRAVRHAPAGVAEWVCYGPFTTLPAGRYRVEFVLKAAATDSAQPLATIDAVANPEASVLAARLLYAGDLPAAGRWARPALTFTTTTELFGVEFRLHTTGVAGLAVDYVEVTALPPESHP